MLLVFSLNPPRVDCNLPTISELGLGVGVPLRAVEDIESNFESVDQLLRMADSNPSVIQIPDSDIEIQTHVP